MASISEREDREIEAANASGSTPVVFIHGLWLLPSSWNNWVELFQQAGYAPLTPDWPDDPAAVAAARANPRRPRQEDLEASRRSHMHDALGTHAVCTNPATCANAEFAPSPPGESWHYSIGHWVEDDPGRRRRRLQQPRRLRLLSVDRPHEDELRRAGAQRHRRRVHVGLLRPADPQGLDDGDAAIAGAAARFGSLVGMAYMLMMVEPVGQRSERGVAAGHVVYDRMLGFAESLKQRGLLRGVESLASLDEGARLQVRDGKARVLDGPFAEAKEMVGGFFLVDVATLDEALALAAECPAAEWCTVEVRKVGPCWA